MNWQPKETDTSFLIQGNKALREKFYRQAIRCYVKALINNPGLNKICKGNIATANRRLKMERKAGQEPLRAGLCGYDPSEDLIERVSTLAEVYKAYADVEIFAGMLPNDGSESWGSIAGDDIPIHHFEVDDQSRFIERALMWIAERPYDIVHLARPLAPNIIIGALYKMIWNARVLVDADKEQLFETGSDSSDEIERFLNGGNELPSLEQLDGPDWSALALGLAGEFDGISLDGQAPELEKLFQTPEYSISERLNRFVERLLALSNERMLFNQLAILPFDSGIADSEKFVDHLDVKKQSKAYQWDLPQRFAHSLSQIESINSPTEFDSEYYLKNNEDVREAGVDPESHYYSNGETEGRKPNAKFDPIFYRNLSADVRLVDISPFHHFCNNGYSEGRLGISPLESSSRKTSSNSKPLLFIGHDGIQAGSEIVLLEVIKWFYECTNRKIKLLLLAPGPVANKYAHYAEVYVLPDYKVDDAEYLKTFLDESFEFVYMNTVVSGRLFELIGEHDIELTGDIVTHIHEMEKVLDEYAKDMNQLLIHTKFWISASPASSATLIEKYAIEAEKVITVPAFINPVASLNDSGESLKMEARNELGLSRDAFVIAGCGTVYWRKGPDLFVEAARYIKRRTGQLCEFVWLGDGPDKEELVNGLTDEEKEYIKFAGNRADSNKMLSAANLFFLASREDPFPLVVLESAQHAVPTVCFAPATGITEFIKDDAGISVNAVDAVQAAEAMLELMMDRPRLEALGAVAKKRLFSTYTSEKQNIKIFGAIKQHTSYKPSVSVIVPFYNHEKFLHERIDSIIHQKIKDIEIIALDDCSTDKSVESLEPYRNDCRFRLIVNEKNSGSPFRQWEKGIAEASSDIVWIAEGDDTCDRNFLQTLLPHFNDPMVNIASAKTEIINEFGELQEKALKPYLDSAFEDKFESSYVKDGFQEINEQLGAVCTLVNASALLIRKSSIGNSLSVAQTFKMCGDWLIYLQCLKNGKIAYSTETHNYFRRHTASQVHKVEGTDIYFSERKSITEFVFKNFPVSQRLVKKAFAAIDHEWARFKYKHPEKVLDDLYSKDQLIQQAKLIKNRHHVAFYVHGMLFSKGGIERLAAQLANYLVEQGWTVTIYCRISSAENPVYPLYESVNVVPVFDEHKLESSVYALRQRLLHSDIEVFVPMLSEWLFDPIVEAAQTTGIPVIVSEHNDPWKIEELWWSHDRRIKCFEKVDGIHLLLHKFNESLPEELRNKVTVITNGVHIPESLPNEKREKLIVGVGRLEPQKRFDRLIEAVGQIQGELRTAGYRIEIYGEGSLKSSLLQQISELGVNDLVYLMGKTSQIETVYRRASLFVLPSEFEGFGIVVVEALSFGVPVIAFRDCNGPNEIIREDLDGWLVNSINDLAEKIVYFIGLTNLDLHRKNARERAMEYSIEHFFNRWEDKLKNIQKL